MSQVIDGKALAERINAGLRQRMIEKLGKGERVGLAILLIGNDKASRRYVAIKQKACQKIGIDFHKYLFEEDAREQEILQAISFLNRDKTVHAILVQLPLPRHLDTDRIIRAIDPKKDVDGFHPDNVKLQMKGKGDLVPVLHLGILELLESTKETIEGKSALIIANSHEFADPLAAFLKRAGTESSVAIQPETDKETLENKSSKADILIVAMGKPRFVTKSFVKKDAIIIDVGTNYLDDGTLAGDVDFDDVEQEVGHITPVPGGVGPMTVAMLLRNAIDLAEKSKC